MAGPLKVLGQFRGDRKASGLNTSLGGPLSDTTQPASKEVLILHGRERKVWDWARTSTPSTKVLVNSR
jgi:hypothetical protein